MQQLSCKNCTLQESPTILATPAAAHAIPAALKEENNAELNVPEVEQVPVQDEVLSPEEALPEEMVPDQEPPAVQQPVKSEEPLLNQTEPVKEEKPARISSVDIEAIKKPKTVANNEKPSAPKAAPVPAPPSPPAYENPPVVTRTLYVKGHNLPAKDVCPNKGDGLKLMILITSAPSHSAQREAVRSTWGHVAFRRDVGMAFFVGTSKNEQENQIIAQENLVYGDIIQVAYIHLM